MPESIVAPLDANQAIALWPQIEKWLEPACAEEGCYLPVDILLYHLRGEMTIWVSFVPDLKKVEAVMVLQVDSYPRTRWCVVRYVRGENMSSWAERFQKGSEAFARSRGCSKMCGGHRRGWVRIAGYKEVGPMLMKELTR